MKKIWLLLITLFISACATTSTHNIKPGMEAELKNIKSISLRLFKSNDETISEAVRNTIVETLLPTDIKVVNENNTPDAIVQGSISFTYDSVASGFAHSGKTSGSAYGSGTSGGYVSGITAQIVVNNEIVAAASETQTRTDLWIPDPAEVMARKIGDKLVKILKH
ncbi:MAG: hypothetical protein NTU66_07500 [Elusimicrobia bacterium]|nr:hypothetical protein [Elusimicrobiota bacterium]